MENKDLEKFLYKARAKTYAGGGGKVKPALSGSTQLEYKEGDWFYRDVYYTSKNTFMGMDTVYFKNKPVFCTSYYGNWGEMTEDEIDDILRGALLANPETRAYKKIEWYKDDYKYECTPDSFSKSINEIGGYESISKKLASNGNGEGDEIYHLYYAGSVLV